MSCISAFSVQVTDTLSVDTTATAQLTGTYTYPGYVIDDLTICEGISLNWGCAAPEIWGVCYDPTLDGFTWTDCNTYPIYVLPPITASFDCSATITSVYSTEVYYSDSEIADSPDPGAPALKEIQYYTVSNITPIATISTTIDGKVYVETVTKTLYGPYTSQEQESTTGQASVSTSIPIGDPFTIGYGPYSTTVFDVNWQGISDTATFTAVFTGTTSINLLFCADPTGGAGWMNLQFIMDLYSDITYVQSGVVSEGWCGVDFNGNWTNTITNTFTANFSVLLNLAEFVEAVAA